MTAKITVKIFHPPPLQQVADRRESFSHQDISVALPATIIHSIVHCFKTFVLFLFIFSWHQYFRVVLEEWEDAEDLQDVGWTTSKTGQSYRQRSVSRLETLHERQQWRELVWSSSLVSNLQQWSWSEEEADLLHTCVRWHCEWGDWDFLHCTSKCWHLPTDVVRVFFTTVNG